MSVQYLLDGYNILNQIPALTPKKLEDKRHSLIQLIELYRPQGSPKNAVTIVFDGKGGIWGGATSSSVKVIFTTDETADEKIKSIVTQAKNKKQIVVVTNDRDIKYYVRALGATVVKVEDFVAKLKPRENQSYRGTKTVGVRETTKVIPKTLEYKINAELEDVWLRKRKDKK